MAGTRKYNRIGFFDFKADAWKTYYTSRSGKIVVKKFENYNELKTDIKKNHSPNLKRDIAPKKSYDDNRLQSAVLSKTVVSRYRMQKAIDRDIKKYKAKKEVNVLNLEKNILATNYKSSMLDKIPRQFLPDEKSFRQDFYEVAYTSWKYEKPLHFGSSTDPKNLGSYHKICRDIDSPTLKRFDKFNMDIVLGKTKISGIINRCDFSNQDKMELKLKSFLNQDPGLVSKKYEKMKITIKGIKF